MHNLKIYLDTSVISHLDAPDALEKMQDTLALWDKIKSGVFSAYLSSITLGELDECPEPKRSILFSFLRQIQYDLIALDSQAIEIADKLVSFGILKHKSIDDCQHIAAAIIGGCDAIISWNFKHIVNHKTIQGVKAITALTGFPDIFIYTPSILLGGESNDS